MDNEKIMIDYQDKYINQILNDGVSSAIMFGHLQSIAKLCGINPNEYIDSASLTYAIADVLDKYLTTEDKIEFIEEYDDGTQFIQYTNGWSYGYKNKLNFEKRTEETNEDIVNWVNDNGGIDRVRKCVQYVKWIEDFQKEWDELGQ